MVIARRLLSFLRPVVVVACAALAASAAGHVIEASAIPESADPVRHPADSTVVPSVGNSHGSPRLRRDPGLVARNMFCSACEPPEVDTPPEPGGDPGVPPLTSLPLRVLATNVASRDDRSFATILHTSSSIEGAYSTGDEIPGAGPVVHVGGRYVDFENRSGGRVERIALGAAATPPVADASAPPPPPLAAKADLAAEIQAGVVAVDDSTFELSRGLVDKVLANPTAVMRGARVTPSADGLKMYAIRPGSAFASIGLKNGDTVNAVNGLEITSLEKGLEVFTKVRESSSLIVSITRRGKPHTLRYSIR